jgi:hypothetical protein
LLNLQRTLVLSALAAGISAFGAEAAVLPADDGARPPARIAAEGVQLAQYGDVEIFYDEFGRRVIVDAYTGEVISVERPRRGERRQRREERRLRRDAVRGEQERYYIDDPEDMRRLREQKLRDAGIIARPPPVDDYRDYSRQALPRGLEDYPEAPGRAFPAEPPPDVVAREPAPGQFAPGGIERQPLGSPQAEPGEEPSVAELPAPTSIAIIVD